MDWREFVETLSSVEQTLRDDPSGVYAQMDFAHARPLPPRGRVDREARQRARETEVARLAVAARRRERRRPAPTPPRTAARAHVGYYLIGDGPRSARATRPACACRRRSRCARRVRRRAARGLRRLDHRRSRCALVAGAAARRASARRLALVGRGAVRLALLLATSQLAVALVNWLVDAVRRRRSRCRGWTFRTASRPSRARWSSCRRCSATPRGVEALVEALEVRFLANRDPHLHFALLTDFHDAAEEHLPGDAALVELARDCASRR